MLEQNGDNYLSSKYLKMLAVAEAKIGKSTALIGNVLGVMPWQDEGGLVSSPEHLHVVTSDANALGGIKSFITKTCGANDTALKFRVYNMQEDVRRVGSNDADWDNTFFGTLMTVVEKVESRVKKEGGTHVLLFSSLTGFAQALERALAGPPGKRGSGMDQSKWQAFAHQLNELRNYAQNDLWHCIWEGHIFKPEITGQDGRESKETLQMSGKSGRGFGYNVEQVIRIRREFGQLFTGSKCDKVHFDTRSEFDFITGGRNFTEYLEPREYDLAKAARKLGVEVGGWRHKAPKPVAVKPAGKVA